MTSQRRAERRGAAVVEFAILLPFLTFLFLVAIDFSRIFYYGITIENCARNGALFAANVNNDTMPYGSIQEAAIADGANLTPPLTAGDVSVSPGTDADGNATVTVTVTYTFTTFTKYPAIPNQVTLVQSVAMRSAS